MQLGDSIQIQLKLAVHNENVFKSDVLSLSGTGWRVVYANIVREKCKNLNTPKADNLDMLFKQCLGLKDISKTWSHSPTEIDSFVRRRGHIAHKGSEAPKVSKTDTVHFKALIQKTISDTDDAVYSFLKHDTPFGKAPWQKTAK